MLGRLAETIGTPQPSKNQVALPRLQPQHRQALKGDGEAQFPAKFQACGHAVCAKDISLAAKRNARDADGSSLGAERHP